MSSDDPKELARQLLERLARAGDDARAMAELVTRLAAAAPAPAVTAGQDDAETVLRLSQENLELADRLAEAEEMNAAMMNMYVSSYQLHATLDPERVVGIIKEVVINFVGAEEFAVLLRDEEADDLAVVAGEEAQKHYPTGRAEAQGVLGAVVVSGEPFVHAEEGVPRESILAAVPLAVSGRVVGAVVLFKLLEHKTRLGQADVELLHLLSAHAATALLNARQYSRMERKLRTLEQLMSLLAPQQRLPARAE
ncbi:MAG: GAF domain-containing protein [Deltaproteobacteria bacterium]|nr:GAF domain-containing protein [Deltaproteobacteria bacterium]